MNFTKVKVFAGKTGAQVKKYSPEILMGVSILSFGASVYFTAKKTPKAVEIMKQASSDVDGLKKQITDHPGCDVSDVKKEIRKANFGMAKDLAKTYAIPAGFFLLGVASACGSLAIMKKRYTGAVVALAAVSKSYQEYRARVVEKYGADVDHRFFNGITEEKIEQIDPDTGKKSKVKADVVDEDFVGTAYARIFDHETAPSAFNKDNGQLNEFEVATVEKMANEMLQTRGHVMLNDVYDALGLRRSEEGCHVGWLSKDWYGDVLPEEYFDRVADDHVEIKRYMVHVRGGESTDLKLMVDFNCDGVISDKINLSPFYNPHKIKKLVMNGDEVEAVEA